MTITPGPDDVLWLDFETTGLMNDPNTVPLEGAAIITDGQLNELATFESMVIHATEDELAHMGEFVTNMHTKTGLLEKVRASTIAREEFDVHLKAGWLSGLERSAKVAGIVPSGFESYLRILHKTHPAETDVSGPVPTATWQEVASALGQRLTPETRWAELSGAYGEAASVPGLGTVYPPEEGRLDSAGFNALARVLAEHVDGVCLAAFWTGWEPLQDDGKAAAAIRGRAPVGADSLPGVRGIFRQPSRPGPCLAVRNVNPVRHGPGARTRRSLQHQPPRLRARALCPGPRMRQRPDVPRGPCFYDACMEEHGLAEVAAQLYAVPFDEFVAARTAAAKDAAAAKERSFAAEVRSLPKPSVAAWTVNMLAARRPETLHELVALGRSMRAAQSALDAGALRRLGQERRQLLGRAVRSAQQVAAKLGRKISGAIAAEVEETLRAATADEGAAAAVQSGRLLRGLSADGVDVVDLSGAVALPGLMVSVTATRVWASSPPEKEVGTKTAAGNVAEQPRLRAVRQEPRRPTPSALERARTLLKDAESAAGAAAGEARQDEEELASATALAAELSDTVRNLREQLARCELELRAARKRRELAGARAQQSARAAGKARRTADLARERVLRLGNTPDS